MPPGIPIESIPVVGINWPKRYVQRVPELATQWAKPMDNKRIIQHNRSNIQSFFELYKEVVADYKICPADIYNMDKTGFRMGVGSRQKVLGLSTTKGVRIGEPYNREF